MKTEKENIVNEVHWENALTYSEYKNLIAELLKIDKTTGENQSKEMIAYTQLNVQRMNKWDKTIVLQDELKNIVEGIKNKQNWLILTEAWCGDAAQNIPIINKIAESNSNIEFRLLLRNENLDIMDQHLTNGGRSIPILIMMDEDFNQLKKWGPRPAPAHAMQLEYKEKNEITHDEFAILLHTWYAKDKANTLQREFSKLL